MTVSFENDTWDALCPASSRPPFLHSPPLTTPVRVLRQNAFLKKNCSQKSTCVHYTLANLHISQPGQWGWGWVTGAVFMLKRMKNWRVITLTGRTSSLERRAPGLPWSHIGCLIFELASIPCWFASIVNSLDITGDDGEIRVLLRREMLFRCTSEQYCRLFELFWIQLRKG